MTPLPLNRLTASPACNPDLAAEAAMAAYARLGFRQFEVFTDWAKSSLVVGSQAEAYRALANRYGMAITSMHFPKVIPGDEASWELFAQALQDAKTLGVRHAILKCADRPAYRAALPRMLDLLDPVGLTGLVGNHKGTAINSPEDLREVLEAVSDPRLRVLFEVGHFEAVGVRWADAYPLVRERLGLVHLKDIRDGRSVLYGTGTVDLPGLFERLESDGYTGSYVIEIEVREPGGSTRPLEHALAYLRARSILREVAA